LGRPEDLLWILNPESLAAIIVARRALTADLRAAAARLEDLAGDGASPALLHRTRAVVLSALRDPAAEDEANRAVRLAPMSVEAYLVRARVRRRAGDLAGARADVAAGFERAPADPRLLELNGMLDLDNGRAGSAIIALERAVEQGGLKSARGPLARALMANHRYEAAVDQWTQALKDEPDNPQAFLGRARALLHLGLVDRALADLEQAAEWSADDPVVLAKVAITYARALPGRPQRLRRWLHQVCRVYESWRGPVGGRRPPS
jgi:tetratricopeptide (TPR) repeat protein